MFDGRTTVKITDTKDRKYLLLTNQSREFVVLYFIKFYKTNY